MPDLSDDELLAELGVSAAPKKTGALTAREERIVAGFEDIQRFVETHGRLPLHGEGHDIFERLYAVRLDRLRDSPEAQTLLTSLDTQGILSGGFAKATFQPSKLDDDALLEELAPETPAPNDIRVLRHVRSQEERRAAEEVASRSACPDFNLFRPLFEQVEGDLRTGMRQSRPFARDPSVSVGNFFILGGQFAYVAEMSEWFKAPNGDDDARLRVIYANGTESNLLMRSLQRALYKDETGRRITDPNPGPLFSEQWEENDVESGTIYVLRSLSEHPFVAEHRELIHKIGVTGGDVKVRIGNASQDATYLLADVEVVATYKLSAINRTKLEGIFHRIFAPAQIDLTIQDRFGHPVRPREWFLVPLSVIDEAVRRVTDGTITEFAYDPKVAALVRQ